MAKEKILVVDDEPLIRWTLNEALRSWGYEPIEAGTIAGALSSFDADRPVAVLLDINLPDGSGLDALRETIRRQLTPAGLESQESVLVTNLRQAAALERALHGARQAAESLGERRAGECIAMDLRIAADALGEVTGAITTDDILERIFSEFCIGK